MRRKDKEMHDISEMLRILDRCQVMRLAMEQDGQPYLVPLNYGYTYENEKLTLYFHSGRGGMKLDHLAKNNRVCFEVDCDLALITADAPCDYGYEFSSIIGFGTAQIVEDAEAKSEILNLLMQQLTGQDKRYEFDEKALIPTVVVKIAVDSFTGKQKHLK